jgi:hypothetical protein
MYLAKSETFPTCEDYWKTTCWMFKKNMFLLKTSSAEVPVQQSQFSNPNLFKTSAAFV